MDFDDKGSNAFCRRYRIRRSRSYFIRYHGQGYNMKAVTRAALGLVSGPQAVRAPLRQSAAVKRRLERDDVNIKVVHHGKTYDRASTEGRRYWTEQKKAERDRRLAREAMRLNRPRHGGWIHRRGPWRSFDAVEYATLEWVDWFNNQRLLGPIGNIPPAEAEANHYAASENLDMAA